MTNPSDDNTQNTPDNEDKKSDKKMKEPLSITGLLENIMLESLKEQRRKRRWGIFFKFITIILVLPIIAVIASFNMSDGDNAILERHTALIKVDGTIESEGKSSASTVIKALHKAYGEKLVTGVILRINSPGGSPVQAGIIYDEMVRLREAYPDKPMHVVVEEVCASGGYYIASGAENIYVNKASIVGSIGVMINGFGFTHLMDKLGVERRLLTSGKNKGFMDPFSPQTEQQKAHALSMIDQIHQQFIDVVREGRGERLKENEDTFSGMIWTGVRAIELGLADDYGTVESVSKEVFGNKAIVDYTETENISDRVLKKFGASVGYGAAQSSLEGAMPSLR